MLSRQGGDQERVAWMLFYLADILSIQGEYAKGCVLFEESIALHRQLNNKRGLAYVLMQQAFYLFISQDDRALLHTRLEESRAIWQELGDADGFARYCWLAGWIALRRGDRESARALSEESLRLFKEAGNQWFTAWTLSVVARVEVGEENYAAARTLYEGSLAITQVLGDTWLTAFCLEGLAGVAAAQGNPQWAARLWGAAECLRETIGAPIPPVERANYEHSIAATRASLGTASFAALWTEGRAMTPAQALAAQDRTTVSQPSTTTKITPTSPVSLTAREIEVLRLVTQGMTDTQVAEILVISPRTVNWYLTSIYSKLGVSSRSAATRRAIEQHLV